SVNFTGESYFLIEPIHQPDMDFSLAKSVVVVDQNRSNLNHRSIEKLAKPLARFFRYDIRREYSVEAKIRQMRPIFFHCQPRNVVKFAVIVPAKLRSAASCGK